jgi:hypothetical protein
MGAKLTKTSDRLVALQGLATQVEQLTGQRYCAGFWINDNLPTSLLWTAAAPPFLRPREYRAPSWSWASIDGSVNFNYNRFTGTVSIQILDVQPILDHSANFKHRNSIVRPIALNLRGVLLPALVIATDNGNCESLMKRPSQDSGIESSEQLEQVCTCHLSLYLCCSCHRATSC